jgi:hypothetical protein
MAHTVNFDSCVPGHSSHIVLRKSTDGINFSGPTPLVAEEDGFFNQNPALFRDPVQQRFYLYWYRGFNSLWEIRTKSASTIEELATAESRVIASAPVTVAAPQVMYFNGTYYLAVETEEQGGIWMTRVLTSTMPDQGFIEIPGNPILGDGSACFFQHIIDNKLHAYYCKLTDSVWTLDHRSADLPGV